MERNPLLAGRSQRFFARIGHQDNRLAGKAVRGEVQAFGVSAGAHQQGIARLQRTQDSLDTLPLADGVAAGQHEADRKLIASFQFLTEQPFIAVINVSDADAGRDPPFAYGQASATLALSAQTEAEIAELDPADRAAFLEDLGVTRPAGDRLIQTCHDAMGLISFLTVGDAEVRAWSVRPTSPAL